MNKLTVKILMIVFVVLLGMCGTILARQNSKKEHQEIPPKSYIKTLQREADAVVKIHLDKITLDSCRTCTSTGQLFIVEGSVKKIYSKKTGQKISTKIVFTSSANREFYEYPGRNFIVFLNKVPAKNYEAFKSITWTASQASEFQYNKTLESYVIPKRKK